MAFWPLGGESFYRFTGISRSEGQWLWKTDMHHAGDPLELWLAFRNMEETSMSDSVLVEVD